MARRYYRRRRRYYPRRRRSYRRGTPRPEWLTYFVPASTVFGAAVTTTWTNFDLASLWPGFQLGARTGLRIAIRSLKFDGVLQGGQAQSALDDLYNRFRIVIAKWNSNAFGGATVWPTQNGWTVDSGIHRKWNDCGLMKVYMDRRFVLEPLLTKLRRGTAMSRTRTASGFAWCFGNLWF